MSQQMNYKLIKRYPGLSPNIKEGDIFSPSLLPEFYKIVINHITYHIPKKDIEDEPEYYTPVKTYIGKDYNGLFLFKEDSCFVVRKSSEEIGEVNISDTTDIRNDKDLEVFKSRYDAEKFLRFERKIYSKQDIIDIFPENTLENVNNINVQKNNIFIRQKIKTIIMNQHIDYKCTIWKRITLSSKEQLDESIEYLKSGVDISDHKFYKDTIFQFDLESEEFIHPMEDDNQVTIQAFNIDESEEPIWENKPLIQNEYVRINRIELSSEIAAMKMNMIYPNGEWQNIPEDPKGTITVKEDYQSEFHQYIDEAEEMILLCQ